MALPAQPNDSSFFWSILPGYVYKDGSGDIFARSADGDQFWEDCPIPGETSTSKTCE